MTPSDYAGTCAVLDDIMTRLPALPLAPTFERLKVDLGTHRMDAAQRSTVARRLLLTKALLWAQRGLAYPRPMEIL